MAESSGDELSIESESDTGQEVVTSDEEERVESESDNDQEIITPDEEERVESESDTDQEIIAPGEEERVESEPDADQEIITPGEEERVESEPDTDQEITPGKEESTLEELIRDDELFDAVVEEVLERWEHFLPKESVLSRQGNQEVQDNANDVSDLFATILHDDVVERASSGIEDGRAWFLSGLGRGVSRCREVFLDAVFWPSLEEREAIALCANLKSDSNIRKLNLWNEKVFGTPQMCAVLADALTTNSTLAELDIMGVGMTPVALRCLLFGGGRSGSSWHPTTLESELAVQVRKRPNDYGEISKLQSEIKMEVEKLGRGGLLANVTLESLHILYNELFDTSCLAVFLSKNPALKSLRVHRDSLDFLSAKGIAEALRGNTNLESLDLGGNHLGCDGVKLIFESLSQNIMERGTKVPSRLSNSTLKNLEIGGNWVNKSRGSLAVAALAMMLETNNTLVCLSLKSTTFEAQHWTEQILPALSKNKTLEKLDLASCQGMTGEEVSEALLKVVQENNTGLRVICLEDTGMAEWQSRINEELRINAEYRDKLRDQSMVTPTSGRLVLCGYEFAGKTTIRNTLERISHPDTPTENLFQTTWKRLMRMVPCLQQILYGTDAPKEFEDRTRGFNISIIDNGPPKISVWDFAGQKEYYALHDYLFPDVKNSCFVYVCSCRCPPSDQNRIGAIKLKEKMKEEFHFWMRFIASNSKVTPRTTGEGHGIHLPYVHFVLTNIDTLPRSKGNDSAQWARSAVDDLREEFEGVLELCQSISIVNAHSPGDVENLKSTVNLKLQEILNSPTEYEICKEVRSALEEWSKQNPSNPLMSLQQFRRICEDDIPNRPGALGPYRDAKLYNEESQRAILAYLNNAGDIIYPKEFDFIVVNPRWFGIGILGQLIDVMRGAGTTVYKWNGIFGHPNPTSKVYHQNGFVSRSNVKELVGDSLKSLDMQDVIPDNMLIELMIKLEMWFNEIPGNPNSRLFFPALLDDDTESATKGERKLKWSVDRGIVYVGRRLQCMDKVTTFLTPGFFPRLQVNLVNYLRTNQGVDNSHIKVDRNLIKFKQNEKQVFVEYSGDIDYFIDILVKSSKSHEETLQFIENHLVKKIQEFCASPQGCQGVILEEAVIRPLCVKDLHVCAARKGHSVLVSALKEMIKKEGKGYQHDWPGNGDETCAEYALDLLEGEGSYSTACSSSSIFGPGRDDIHGDNQRKSSKGDQLPRYLLSIKNVGMLGKVNAYAKGLMPFKLHLFCDIKEGSTLCTVKGQPGRDMKLDHVRHGSDFALLKPVVKFLWDKAGPGFSIDNFINYIFGGSDMPSIDRNTLQKLINSGKTLTPVSDDDVVKALENYIAHTPGCLKKLLEVDTEPKFYEDFRLRRVEYSQPAGKIMWLCPKHYESPVIQKQLKSYTID